MLLTFKVVTAAGRVVVLVQGATEVDVETTVAKVVEATIPLMVLTYQTQIATSQHKNGRP